MSKTKPATSISRLASWPPKPWPCAPENAERTADFQAIDKSHTEIQRQVRYLDEIRTWSGTIKNSAEKVIDRVERMQKALDSELETLGQQVEQFKSLA